MSHEPLAINNQLINYLFDYLLQVLGIRYWVLSRIPIPRARLSTKCLLAHGLEDTRKFVDDNPEMHSWMAGIAFDYWEQYLTLESFVYSIGGIL